MDSENYLKCVEMFPDLDTEIILIVVQEKLTFEEMLSMPIVKLGPTSNRLLEKAGLQNINEDWVYPFKRYKIAGIEDNIKLPNGVPVKFDNFTLMKHFQIYNILKL